MEMQGLAFEGIFNKNTGIGRRNQAHYHARGQLPILPVLPVLLGIRACNLDWLSFFATDRQRPTILTTFQS
ncbi:hypothetical protein GJ744_011506 [Endocarpon pusillum]|uniref:Uncharacterized protein n=1 Tax=Endocarpon pusillum TaxID=364733 RepID=A0A8H7AGP2_9EURO|nr:hypothetical protein GJ744_011506 [Endocarpon pusillum]